VASKGEGLCDEERARIATWDACIGVADLPKVSVAGWLAIVSDPLIWPLIQNLIFGNFNKGKTHFLWVVI